MRHLRQTPIKASLFADLDAVVGANWSNSSPDRTAQRKDYRSRDLDARVSIIEVAVLKLGPVTRLPDSLLGDANWPRWR